MRTTESAQFELGATPIEEIVIDAKTRNDTGRPSMDLWRILVLAMLKQGFPTFSAPRAD